MAVEKFTYFVGLVGLTPQYHTLYVNVPDKIHPVHKKPEAFGKAVQRVEQNLMLSSRRKFYKIHKNKKISENYEGTGKNFNR